MKLNILFFPVPDTVAHQNLLKYGNHQVKWSGNVKKIVLCKLFQYANRGQFYNKI
jgi:hypothetical protein